MTARSIGVDVWPVRLVAYVVSGAGCTLAGAAHTGAMFLASDAAFDTNWVVMMMFATLIGGVGTIAGPLLGVLVWCAQRKVFATMLSLPGGWYLIGMGLFAMAVSLYAPRSLWGLQARRA